MSLTIQITIAFIADLLLGDPKGYPHPVKIIARLAYATEKLSRKLLSNHKLAGAITTITVVSTSYLIVWMMIQGLALIHPSLGLVISIFFIYTTLSVRSLFDESLPIFQHLRETNLSKARESLSRIVGRDTTHLEEDQIVRATVETVAESTVDGIIAPLFFAVLGGAPLAAAYKAVNTMDSLFGYKNETYLDFGWAPARLDDIANWLPARLSLPIITLGATLSGLNGRKAWVIARRDGRKHPSPNSGIPEAAMAGALGVQLGGVSYYSGIENKKPLIGDPDQKLQFPDIVQSQKLMFASAFLALVVFLVYDNFQII
jgi:adenosylcobinamide-phosphate synthase